MWKPSSNPVARRPNRDYPVPLIGRFLWAAACAGLMTGCVQEMANQPRLEPLEASPLTGEMVPPRSPVAGTVPRGRHHPAEPFRTGRIDGEFATSLPPAVSERYTEAEILDRGGERYSIFCAPCHGLVGGGEGGDIAYRGQVGMVVRRGFPTPPTYHQPRLREAPLGHFFDVITHGIGRMPAHGYMIPPEDRWAIAAYIQALQLSQHAPRELLSPEDLDQLAQNARQE